MVINILWGMRSFIQSFPLPYERYPRAPGFVHLPKAFITSSSKTDAIEHTEATVFHSVVT